MAVLIGCIYEFFLQLQAVNCGLPAEGKSFYTGKVFLILLNSIYFLIFVGFFYFKVRQGFNKSELIKIVHQLMLKTPFMALTYKTK